MATVSRSAVRDEVSITMTAQAAEALMQILQVATHETVGHPVTAEFESVWNGLVDEFVTDQNYSSLAFGFDSKTTTISDK